MVAQRQQLPSTMSLEKKVSQVDSNRNDAAFPWNQFIVLGMSILAIYLSKKEAYTSILILLSVRSLL